jgi:hypothetical protein
MNVFSQLVKARLEQVASDLSEAISGLIWHNTTSKKIKFYDGVEVKELVDTDSAQELTNKTLTSPVITTPTGILKADVGLSEVDNTSDSTKNAAVATLTNKTLTAPHITAPTGILKDDVGLSEVDNTSDATKDSAVSTLTNKTLTAPIVNNPVIDGYIYHGSESVDGSWRQGVADGKLLIQVRLAGVWTTKVTHNP